MIKLYCVGIHFKKDIPFMPDVTDKGVSFMSGKAVLAAAAKLYNLRYQLNIGTPVEAVKGHVEWLSYTPQYPDPQRITFRDAGAKFPYYGLPLNLVQKLNPISEISDVFQYTVLSLDPFNTPTPKTQFNTGEKNLNSPDPFLKTGDSQFGENGFPDNCEIRIRLLSIYCTLNP
jgi:hypothetical protein